MEIEKHIYYLMFNYLKILHIQEGFLSFGGYPS